ncbi:hypothetical protein AYI69_g4393 [Smittium culicis]|uniref:CCHC-type domain-containing protein n=1 Tax=Smittium culicis TaxID=133412 RepID=A0A1R1YDZ2_9FUNG|nr:hypothetical protein AYI69_g4390 [Smittium culicis]OMJ25137.1 hypothetical protein AYI69_g4393 [Smittium culicis]
MDSKITFDGLPEKFQGTKAKTIAKAWCRRFERIIKLKTVDETHALLIFKAWMDNDAEEWIFEMESATEKTKSWTLKDWKKGLQTKFPEASNKNNKNQFTTRDLDELTVIPKESIHDFNNRFRTTLSQIPEDMYTDKIVKRGKTKKRALFMKSIKIKEEPEAVEISKQTETKEKEEELDIKELNKMMREMTLFLKKSEVKQKDTSYYHCFNCDTRGHRTNECKKPRNEEMFNKLLTEYKRKKAVVSEENKTLFMEDFDLDNHYDGAESDYKEETEHILATANKRMRVDPIPETPNAKISYQAGSVPSLKEKVNKKKKETKKQKLLQHYLEDYWI